MAEQLAITFPNLDAPKGNELEKKKTTKENEKVLMGSQQMI